MRPGYSFNAPAPSSALLHFLKSQTEGLCFFSPSSTSICQNATPRQTYTTPRDILTRAGEFKRCLTTTSRSRANVEASLLNFDILRAPPKHHLHHDGGTKTLNIGPVDASRHSRYASTDSQSLLKRLWKHKEKREKPKIHPTGLRPLPGFLDEVGSTNLGRKKPGKAVNELKLRCTEFDNEGKVTLMDGEFKKTELIAKVIHSSIVCICLTEYSTDEVFSTVFYPEI